MVSDSRYVGQSLLSSSSSSFSSSSWHLDFLSLDVEFSNDGHAKQIWTFWTFVRCVKTAIWALTVALSVLVVSKLNRRGRWRGKSCLPSGGRAHLSSWNIRFTRVHRANSVNYYVLESNQGSLYIKEACIS